ncbi:hypothetical protein GCM10023231_19790 [Olivibacter ginsenosidimutans]|uniref:Glyoxalase/fosfomycin resistance/dioxygenase domain-containing protein n=2 Tax=Olivibacter ginsenosidimutans TaxID=1176537 RepID=A0ABP9B8Q6_9SPHI
MTFYQYCLGGKLHLQTLDSLWSSTICPIENLIVNATLIHDGLTIMASDLVDEMGLQRGNAVSIMLNCQNIHELKNCYRKLADGATSLRPLGPTYWNALFGSLTDKYGNNWLLYYQDKLNKKD